MNETRPPRSRFVTPADLRPRGPPQVLQLASEFLGISSSLLEPRVGTGVFSVHIALLSVILYWDATRLGVAPAGLVTVSLASAIHWALNFLDLWSITRFHTERGRFSRGAPVGKFLAAIDDALAAQDSTIRSLEKHNAKDPTCICRSCVRKRLEVAGYFFWIHVAAYVSLWMVTSIAGVLDGLMQAPKDPWNVFVRVIFMFWHPVVVVGLFLPSVNTARLGILLMSQIKVIREQKRFKLAIERELTAACSIWHPAPQDWQGMLEYTDVHKRIVSVLGSVKKQLEFIAQSALTVNAVFLVAFTIITVFSGCAPGYWTFALMTVAVNFVIQVWMTASFNSIGVAATSKVVHSATKAVSLLSVRLVTIRGAIAAGRPLDSMLASLSHDLMTPSLSLDATPDDQRGGRRSNGNGGSGGGSLDLSDGERRHMVDGDVIVNSMEREPELIEMTLQSRLSEAPSAASLSLRRPLPSHLDETTMLEILDQSIQECAAHTALLRELERIEDQSIHVFGVPLTYETARTVVGAMLAVAFAGYQLLRAGGYTFQLEYSCSRGQIMQPG